MDASASSPPAIARAHLESAADSSLPARSGNLRAIYSRQLPRAVSGRDLSSRVRTNSRVRRR
jgi:hypothetical protein